MKLSKAQQDVIDKMQGGWELGMSESVGYRNAWLQKDGLGHGGECLRVRRDVVSKLEAKGVISQIWSFPTSQYVLAEEA